MKKIGLVGGTGPESTLIYYKELNRRINEQSGGTDFPEISIESLNLNRALKYVENEQYAKLLRITRKMTRSPGYAVKRGVAGSPCTRLLNTFERRWSFCSLLAKKRSISVS